MAGFAAHAPRYIATVPRRGYRFVAPVTTGVPPDAGASPAPPVLVERAAVLARLHTALAQARQGQRQVLGLTGEPGIGKTAVLETFAAQVSGDPTVWLAAAQCVEHYGPGE